jgi:hypothetical protein
MYTLLYFSVAMEIHKLLIKQHICTLQCLLRTFFQTNCTFLHKNVINNMFPIKMQCHQITINSLPFIGSTELNTFQTETGCYQYQHISCHLLACVNLLKTFDAFLWRQTFFYSASRTD